uniref:Uncharacterized protein n=1 Tax=Triticum aestivum TaxID=4565 RepID=A0A077RZ57_WHEAT|nr:unnamed protein product [Triticum aestivum]
MAFVAAVEGAAAALRPVLSCAQQRQCGWGAWWRLARRSPWASSTACATPATAGPGGAPPPSPLLLPSSQARTRRATVAEQVRWRVQIAEELPTDLKELPLIHSNDSIKELNRSIEKHEQRHDLVISVLLEPGTPQGSKTIRQMRSCILWMEKRKCRKSKKSAGAAPSKMKSMVVQEDLLKNGAFVVAPVAYNKVQLFQMYFAYSKNLIDILYLPTLPFCLSSM